MKRGEYGKLNNPSKTFFYAQNMERKINDGCVELHFMGGRLKGAENQIMVIVMEKNIPQDYVQQDFNTNNG